MEEIEVFLTSHRHDFGWPYAKTFVITPLDPPEITKVRGYYMYRPVEGDCECDLHGWNMDKEYFHKLTLKENELCQKLHGVQDQMTEVSNCMLEHKCVTGTQTMKSTYNTDYVRPDVPVTEYRFLMAAADTPLKASILQTQRCPKTGYRDPTSFRYTPTCRPIIDPVQPASFKTTPDNILRAHADYPPRTNYMDAYSKTALATLKASQQFMEPLPSTRRRYGETCL